MTFLGLCKIAEETNGFAVGYNLCYVSRIYERVLSYRVSSILSCIDVNFGSNSVSRMLVLGLKIQRGYER